jgi:hypothetical protein
MEWPMAKNGGGQSGNTTSFMNASMSVSYSPDVTLAYIVERALGHALASPVKHRDRKPARAQFPYGLKIFFDELGAALKDADCPLAARWRMPARKPQRHTVAGLDGARDHVLGHRIGGD